jgi:hypothetical protein
MTVRCKARGTAAGVSMKERSDDYAWVICILNDRWRVIVCKGDWQWILQKSKAEGGHGRVWRGDSYFRTRKALVRVCARSYGGCDTQALDALRGLPENFHEYAFERRLTPKKVSAGRVER